MEILDIIGAYFVGQSGVECIEPPALFGEDHGDGKLVGVFVPAEQPGVPLFIGLPLLGPDGGIVADEGERDFILGLFLETRQGSFRCKSSRPPGTAPP